MSSDAAAPCQRAILHGPTMGTRWSASVDCDAALDLDALRQNLAAELQQVDAQMSPWNPERERKRLNRAPLAAWVNMSPDLLAVLS